MKILHTSDWHLGRSLYGYRRYDEYAAFLDWLLETIKIENIDILLVAGDIFDTSTPSNRAQELYYDFLCKVAASGCKHIVIIAGNHDSPTFLNAPKSLLLALNVYVVGAVTDNLADEVFTLDLNGKPSAIICAVPYLRDKDIRTAEPGETIDDKNTKLILGVQDHYVQVCAIAEQKRVALANSSDIPIIAMGHLFTAGGKAGDGVRDLYVGSLAHVGADVFPSTIDYLALGHLHIPQRVGGTEHLRYSGSPIAMGFGEAKQQKKVMVIEFNGQKPTITELPVPRFRDLVRIAGSIDEIQAQLEQLKIEQSQAWLEIEYQGTDIITNLRELIDTILLESDMELIRLKNLDVINRVMQLTKKSETLDDLRPDEVFVRCLDAFEVEDKDRPELMNSYNEIVRVLAEEDINAQ